MSLQEELIQKLNQLRDQATQSFQNQKTEAELYQAKLVVLGKKGELTDILKDLGKLDGASRPAVGGAANKLKTELESLYDQILGSIRQESLKASLEKERVDVALPQVPWPKGRAHPLQQTLSEMKQVFVKLGFDVWEGPEIETEHYNFEALNIPEDHPARDMQDSFYLKEGGRLLRTHTSPVQIRVMEHTSPPICMIAPGAVYRRDSDITHSPMFHQIEGLMVDSGIHMGHLKGVLELFLKEIFGSKLKLQFRPSFFPFTEPSAEVDISCVMCAGKGCRVCKQTGWLEILGCGMVDPNVFSAVGIDSKKYSGFAFGIGIERVAMLKYGIHDIRLFYENDPRFLAQFP